MMNVPEHARQHRSAVRRSLAAATVPLLFALLALVADDTRAQTQADDELALVAALDEARAGRASAALSRLGELVERNPTFRLAQLVYADLLLARAGRFGGFGAAASGPDERVEDLRAEALARLSHQQRRPSSHLLPAPLLSIAPSQSRVLLVDQKHSRLYLFENAGGQPLLVGDYYVSTGKQGAMKEREGDQRTPVGVYFVTTRLEADGLDDFYGAGALPVNYPNEWDDRFGRTGYGIWIHGVPSDTYSRPPRASDGCMALTNGDLASLMKLVDIRNTPVVITDSVDWVNAGEIGERRDELLRTIERWRVDWESRDALRYSSHYAADFSSRSMNRAEWIDHKRRLIESRRHLRVRLDDLSLYAYPGERDLVVASFVQDYDSDAVRERTGRRQYWRRDADGRWRVVYEGEAGFRAEHFRGIPWSARSRLTRLDR